MAHQIDPKELKKIRRKAKKAVIKQNYEDDSTEATADRMTQPKKKAPAKKAVKKKTAKKKAAKKKKK